MQVMELKNYLDEASNFAHIKILIDGEFRSLTRADLIMDKENDIVIINTKVPNRVSKIMGRFVSEMKDRKRVQKWRPARRR